MGSASRSCRVRQTRRRGRRSSGPLVGHFNGHGPVDATPITAAANHLRSLLRGLDVLRTRVLFRDTHVERWCLTCDGGLAARQLQHEQLPRLGIHQAQRHQAPQHPPALRTVLSDRITHCEIRSIVKILLGCMVLRGGWRADLYALGVQPVEDVAQASEGHGEAPLVQPLPVAANKHRHRTKSACQSDTQATLCLA